MMANETKQFHTQQIWGWHIAGYLFLGGLGGGAYVASFLYYTFNGDSMVLALGSSLAFVSLLVGSALLINDLGSKRRSFNVFLRVRTSWLARGAWLITAFLVLNFVLLVGGLSPLEWLVLTASMFSTLGAVTAALGVAVMVYTGFLLNAIQAIDFWRTPTLTVIFILSAQSTGIMGLILLLIWGTNLSVIVVDVEVITTLSRVDMVLLALEGMAIATHLYWVNRLSTAGQLARNMWLRGSLSWQFWPVVVLLGLATPFAFELIELISLIPPSYLWVGMLAGLIGGLYLRKIVLDAGVNEPVTTIFESIDVAS